jgi:hypothetical protein
MIFLSAGHNKRSYYPYERLTFIYTLVHPITKEVRYVGKTDHPSRRYNKHLHSYKKTKSHTACWIKSLELKPEMILIDGANRDNWETKEQHYIKLFLAVGARLTNKAVGGNVFQPRIGKKTPKINKPNKRKPLIIDKEDLLRLYIHENKKKKDIASIYKCSVRNIKKWLSIYKIKKPNELKVLADDAGRLYKYAVNKSHKSELMKLRLEGKTLKQLAGMYNCTISNISNIIYSKN